MFCELGKNCGFRAHEKSLLFEVGRVISTDYSDHGLIFLAGSTASGKTAGPALKLNTRCVGVEGMVSSGAQVLEP